MKRYLLVRLPLYNNTVAEDTINGHASEGWIATPTMVVSNQDLVLLMEKEISEQIKEVIERRERKMRKPEE